MESYARVRDTNLYQAFRSEGYPTSYQENRSTASHYEILIICISTFVTLGITTLIILPGFRGKDRIFVFIRAFISLFIGFSIIICNFGYDWESDEVTALTQYKPGSSSKIRADISLKIGLRGINVTLKAHKDHLPEALKNETIDYNENFSWEWSQGRIGFGPQAGHFQMDYRRAQNQGTPYPILWVAEYFTLDGEGIRFGRHYRLAGWYTHFMLWVAFPLWILANILLHMVIQYGALFFLIMGSVLVSGNIIFAHVRNPIPLKIPFEAAFPLELVMLEPSYSWCYYLNLFNGIFSILIGFIIFLGDLRYPDETSEFFGIDVLLNYEDFYADFFEEKKDGETMPKKLENFPIAGLRRRTLARQLTRLQRRTTIQRTHSIKPDNQTIYETLSHAEPIYDTPTQVIVRKANNLDVIENQFYTINEDDEHGNP